ncbi:MAG: hypothetical protein KBS60_04795 [Phascolarctobacterium sp.]|nr:hypothetical protein [Candidatus Phascolarctobacterium caballi]
MWNRRSGSASLLILAGGLLLAGLGILFSYYFSQNANRQVEYVRGVQRRELGYAAMAELTVDDSLTALATTEDFIFQPDGITAKVTKTVTVSSDNNFRLREVQVASGTEKFCLTQQSFIPSAAVQTRAGSYALSSAVAVSSSKVKYMNGAAYSSGKTFNMPKYDLTNCIEYDQTEINHYGLGGNINYYSKNLTLPKMTYDGNAFVIVEGNLTISNGAVFNGRTVFLVLGTTTINANVRMQDVFLLSNGTVTLGSGCNITGHLRTNMTFDLKGNSNFVAREDAGRAFNGVVFIK